MQRALTLAASALTMAIGVFGVAAAFVLIFDGRLSWWFVPVGTAAFAYLNLSSARQAVRHWRPGPPPQDTTRNLSDNDQPPSELTDHGGSTGDATKTAGCHGASSYRRA